MNILKQLEEKAVYIIREVVSQLNKPTLLFLEEKIRLSCYIYVIKHSYPHESPSL